VYLSHYQPLTTGSTGWSSARYRQGAQFSYATELVNQGHVPITVTGIDTGSGSSLLRTTGVFVGKDGSNVAGDISPRYYEPFHPFSLGPGKSRSILIQSVFDNCRPFAPGVRETFESVHVTFRALGVTNSAWVNYGRPFRINSPIHCTSRAYG
jgi:hypothetical protein